eukprot:3935759-Rhodomonas_salina.1
MAGKLAQRPVDDDRAPRPLGLRRNNATSFSQQQSEDSLTSLQQSNDDPDSEVDPRCCARPGLSCNRPGDIHARLLFDL